MKATLDLIDWLNSEGVNALDLAKMIRLAARRHPVIDAPEKPPVVQVRRWLAGGIPHVKYQALLEMVTEGRVKREDWAR